MRVKRPDACLCKTRDVTNPKCGDSQSRQKAICGETSGSSTGILLRFSPLWHRASIVLRNR
jgi:hypothetical protein